MCHTAPTPDPLRELRIIRMAYRLLMATEHMSTEDEQLIARQVRAVLTTGQRQPLLAGLEPDGGACSLTDPPVPGFTVEERVCQLGYRLTLSQYESLIPRLELRVRLEWRSRFHGEPVHHQRQDWYGEEDASWVDPMIQAYLNQFPSIAFVRAKE